MNTHLKGILITALGVLIVTPDSLFVRLIDGDALVTGFWRALIAGLVVFIAVFCCRGHAPFRLCSDPASPA